MSKVVDDIRKVSQCVYMACDAPVAADVAMKCKAVADSHDKLVDALRDQRSDIEKVFNNLISTGNGEAWSVIKLNNMIVDIDALLAELEGDK